MGKRGPKDGYKPEYITMIQDMIRDASETGAYIESYDVAARIGVTFKTLTNWIGRYPELADEYEELKAYQKSALSKGSLMGKLNPTVSIFLLKARHGDVEKQAVELTNGKNADGTDAAFNVNINVVD